MSRLCAIQTCGLPPEMYEYQLAQYIQIQNQLPFTITKPIHDITLKILYPLLKSIYACSQSLSLTSSSSSSFSLSSSSSSYNHHHPHQHQPCSLTAVATNIVVVIVIIISFSYYNTDNRILFRISGLFHLFVVLIMIYETICILIDVTFNPVY